MLSLKDRLRLCLCALVLPTVLLIARNLSHTHSHLKRASLFDAADATKRFAPLSFAPVSFFVGADPAVPDMVWRFNSRAHAHVSSLCMQSPSVAVPKPPLYLAGPQNASRCIVTHADSSTTAVVEDPAACAELHTDNIICHHGQIEYGNGSFCPLVRPLREFPARDAATAIWLPSDELAVVIPDLWFPQNIFHVSSLLAHAIETIANLPTFHEYSPDAKEHADVRRITLVFRGLPPEQLGRWQNEVLHAQLDGLKKHQPHLRNKTFRIKSLNHDLSNRTHPAKSTSLCARQAVLLGGRAHIYVWPFANNSAVSHDGTRVPRASISFRRRAFDAFDIPSDLPVTIVGRATFEVPPLVVAYAQRATFPDVPGKIPMSRGWRRLNEADEAWLKQTLRAEAARFNAKFRELPDGSGMDVDEQVRLMSGVGLVVGLHGANLVNTMFAPPFAALLEIAPHRVASV